MKDVILVGRGDAIMEVPAEMWRGHLAQAQGHSSERLAFMTPEHHRVRNFAVAELPRSGGMPLAAEDIARHLQLPIDGVKAILDDLQKHLFFLVLSEAGEVSWAFPVTAEKTPHRERFSTGEETFAA